MKIYETQIYNALGGKSEYKHRRNRENVQTTKLQNFLDEFMNRNQNAKINIRDYMRGAK